MSKHLRAKVLLALALCFYNTMTSYALPSQGTLNNTAATINVNNNQMTISGKGNNNIINWATFNVATGETVNFNDKNNYLNLVHGIDMSRIYGTISGGNIVYLVNPNGILFGQGAKLDNIGSFIASTRNISSINQTEFLNNPANTEGVLGSNINGMDNKTYYPSQSKYVPKITVAETQLTKVPGSVDTIVLDGPGGVILKNTAALNQITRIYTNKTGGEIGIGTDSGNIALTQEQKNRIRLINGSVTEAYQDNANVLNKYTAIQGIDDLKSLGNSSNPQQKNLMLWNDIDATGVTDYNPVNASGTFEGMGYRISALQIADNPNSSGDSTLSAGVFGEFSGNIRNLSVEGVNFKGLGGYQNIGGVVGHLKGGVLSNVFASGEIKGEIDWDKMANIGGLVGIDDTNNTYSEIRNSGSNVFIDALGSADLNRRYFAVGGLIGKQNNKGGLYNVYNTGNVNISLAQQYVYLGGLVGYVNNSQKYDILGATNTGSLSSKQGNIMWVQQHVNLGGIVGAVANSNVRIGETSNFGNINDEKINVRHYTNDPEQFIINAGGIVGRSYGSENADNIEIVSVDNKPLNNLYLANQGNVTYNTNFGESKTLSGMAELYDKNMWGIYNIEGIGTGAFSDSAVPGGNDSGTSGGSIGGNGSSTTGGSTGGNGSGTTGGSTGGSGSGTTGGSIGGNGSISTDVASGVLNSGVTSVMAGENNDKNSSGTVSPSTTPKVTTQNNNVNVELQGYNGTVTVILKDTRPNSKIVIDNQINKNGNNANNSNSAVVQVDGASVVVPLGYVSKIPDDEILYGLADGNNYGRVMLDGNMYMKDLKTDAIAENNNIKVTFDVYNHESTSGVVEVYNADGKMIKTEWIEPFKRHAESKQETFEAFGRIIRTEEMSASKTSIELEVPAGGYFRVTNNENNSASLKRHNEVGNNIDTASFFIDILTNLPIGLDGLKEDIKSALNDVFIDTYLEGVQEMGDERIIMGSATQKDIVAKAIEKTLKKKLSAKGIKENLIYRTIDVVSGYTDPYIEFCFAISKGLNKLEKEVSKIKTSDSKTTNFLVVY